MQPLIKNTLVHLAKLIMLASFIIALSTVFIVFKDLAHGIVSGKYFWFYGSVGVVCISTLLYAISQKKRFRFSLTDMFFLLFVGSVFLSTSIFNTVSTNHTKLVLLALLTVLYICLRLVLDGNRQKFYALLRFFIVLTGLTEAIWGLMQLYGFLPSQHNLFKLTGSFFNPGPYAGYLAMVFPLALQFFLKNNNRAKRDLLYKMKISLKNLKIQPVIAFVTPFINKWIGGLTCIAILLVLPASMSRASWLSVIAGSMVVITGQWRKKRLFFKSGMKSLKVIVFILVLCLMAVSFTGIYYLKKDSADGRFLMWKVSVSALIQHPLGVGLGHFPGAYGEVQVAYFASGKATEAEEYVAGNPEYGFNEFLQIGIESGIASLLLFFGMLVCAFRGLIASMNWGVMGALGALLVFGCFSYPFSVLPFLVVFVFLLAMSSVNSVQITQIQRIGTDKKIRSICVIGVSAVCTIVAAFCLWKQYPVYQAYKQWKQYRIFYGMEMYKETAQSYKPLYPYLNDQIQFLFEYGRSLSILEQPEKSNEVLRHAMQISCDPMLYNIMGKNYQALQSYDLAEASLRKASLIVPNRIYPYYLLMQLYEETGNEEKAKATAQIVLTKEPKVQSTAVNEMREEAKKTISE